MFEIREHPEGFGITEVRGLEWDAPISEGATLRTALDRSGVVCLRMPRLLEEAEFESLARLFGPLKDPVGRTRDGGEMRYSPRLQVIDSGFVMTDEIREKLGELSFGGLDDEPSGLEAGRHLGS